MIYDKWLKIITEAGTVDICEEIDNFIILEARASYPVSNVSNSSYSGVDGELPSVATFAPFNLVVKCGFDGIDAYDVNLMEWKLRQIFYKRKPYYIVTSENPGIKYPVQNPDIAPDYSDLTATKFEMTFPVYKGYAESLYKTDQFSLSNGKWQFESGVLAEESIKYKHDTQGFKIYNGSFDEIDPQKHFDLKIELSLDAPKGFELINKTTDTIFKYKKPIKKKQKLVLNGVRPFVDGKNVGIDTNFRWIKLNKGFNEIEINGEGVKNVTSKWTFPFIYR